jgi:hypothetical protein
MDNYDQCQGKGESISTGWARGTPRALVSPFFKSDSTGLQKIARSPPGRKQYKLENDDKLALAFDAFVLSRSLGRKISFGKIIHGYDHPLKALAIRERKIHIVGSPELKMEGTPVYLDVEGLPDRDFSFPDWLGRPRK